MPAKRQVWGPLLLRAHNMADSGWLVRYRAAIYPIANIAVLLAAVTRAGSGEMAAGAAIYVAILFALCSAPLLLLRRLNDRYALLAVFLGLYFIFFGGLDLQTVLFGAGERGLVRAGPRVCGMIHKTPPSLRRWR